MTSIGNYAFSTMPYLQFMTVSKELKILGGSIFRDSSQLEHFTIPSTITSFDAYYSFHRCINLRSIITNLDNTQMLNPGATFYQCFNLKKIIIPKPFIYNSNFAILCTSLEYFNFPEYASGVFGPLTSYSKLKKIIIPQGVTTMGDTLAAHNFHLKEIKFNNTLTTIFVNAFLNCVRLRKLDLPASLEHISAGGFQGLVFMETRSEERRVGKEC